jgi:hypothetical protein
MKRILTFLWAAALVMPVFASNGDTLNIGGVVPLILNLTVTPTDPYDNLDLMSDPAADVNVQIADITIETNNSAGWELWITSNNSDDGNQALVSGDGDTIAYSLTYSGTNGLSDQAVTATTGNMFGYTESGDANVYDEASTLTINYQQGVDYPAGYYSDQLTIVLRAK